MIENNQTRLEEATEEEIEKANTEKIKFPLAGVIVISAIILLMIVCVIVILCLKK